MEHMAKRVLLPVDDSAHSRQACTLAFDLFPDARFVLLHVVSPTGMGFSSEATTQHLPSGWYEKRKAQMETVFDAIETEAGKQSIETEADEQTIERVVECGQPVSAILGAIQEHNIDHVVMGSHGRQGVSRLLVGSVAERVLRRSPVPVTISKA